MRQNKVLPAHSQQVEWYTPQWVFDGLPCTFDLDPCSPLTGPVTPAARHLTKDDDGLASPWGVDELVWLNPPYYREVITDWMRKMRKHGNGIALVYARTDTKWFQLYPPDSIFFIGKRIRFVESGTMLPSEASGGAPSVLLGYGRGTEILRGCTLPGHLAIVE